MGARVLATASGADRERCRTAGAVAVLDHHDPTADLDGFLAALASEGVDVWWDTGGLLRLGQFERVRPGGRILLSAAPRSPEDFCSTPFYTKDLSLLGFAMSNASLADLQAAAATTNQLLALGRLIGRVGLVLPLSRARDAHRMVAAGEVQGRVVIVAD